MASKRPAVDSSGAPPAKRSTLALAPLDIGPAAGEEDLDLKVLKVQNSKLSERLREKNRQQERFEKKIRNLEDDKDTYSELMMSFKRHFGLLRDHLLALLAPLDKDSADLDHVTDCLGDNFLSRLEEPETVDKVFETVNHCLTWVEPGGSGRSKGRGSDEEDDEEMEQADASSHDRKASLVLEELRQRWTQPKDNGQLEGKLVAMETKCEQLEEKLADAKFDLQKSQSRVDHLEVRLADVLEELQKRPTLSSSSPNETSSSVASGDKGQESIGGVVEGGASNSGREEKPTADELEQLSGELADSQALAESRLKEIKQLSIEVQDLKKQLAQLQLDHKKLPDTAVADSALYKTLQTQFSIAVQEVGQYKACLDEARQLLTTAKQQHLMQLEEIRGEETKYQVEVREEMAQLENALLATKREYELLRIEFERTIASNEQAAPIAKELQVTVDSLQKTIQQLKGEVTRYKTRTYKAEQQLAKTQEEREKGGDGPRQTGELSAERTSEESSEVKVQQQKGEELVGGASSEEISKLKEQLSVMKEQKVSLEGQLESLKQATSGEEREKADLLNSEKKLRAQVEELKKKFEEYRKDYERRKDHIREESGRKAKSLLEDNKLLQKELTAKRQEAQALMAEVESTAQAFEEMQEQNIRLLQQLKEKDDANFKLMSERIKSNSVQKLLLEEKDLLHSQLVALSTEKQRLSELISQLEERERNSEVTVMTMDKELTLKQEAIEKHKVKALEGVHSTQEWQLKVMDLESRITNAESALKNKVEECEKENMAAKRSQEEVGGLKRKLEKYKSREWMASSDEVLLEEIKTYKAKLNCPCCSTRKKDTVLTKCFHVFCSECIRSRYDSRLRKCPKCGAAFGANDFHKIYLS